MKLRLLIIHTDRAPCNSPHVRQPQSFFFSILLNQSDGGESVPAFCLLLEFVLVPVRSFGLTGILRRISEFARFMVAISAHTWITSHSWWISHIYISNTTINPQRFQARNGLRLPIRFPPSCSLWFVALNVEQKNYDTNQYWKRNRMGNGWN